MHMYLWVALGSALGGVTRYWCSDMAARLLGETFPWGTLFVNVAGSLVIGIVAALAVPEGRFIIGPTARQFIMVGLCGGFTTFSSFSLQTLNLVHDGEWLYAAVNVLASVALCLLAVWIGYSTAYAVSR